MTELSKLKSLMELARKFVGQRENEYKVNPTEHNRKVLRAAEKSYKDLQVEVYNEEHSLGLHNG